MCFVGVLWCFAGVLRCFVVGVLRVFCEFLQYFQKTHKTHEKHRKTLKTPKKLTIRRSCIAPRAAKNLDCIAQNTTFCIKKRTKRTKYALCNTQYLQRNMMLRIFLSLRKCSQKTFAKHVPKVAKHPQNTAKHCFSQNTRKKHHRFFY